MAIVIILAIVSSYIIGSSFIPPRLRRMNFGVVLALLTTILGFVELKFWGFLLLVGMVVATLLVLFFRMATAMGKISRNVDTQLAKDKYLDEEKKAYADDPDKLAQIEALKDETFNPGKAAHIKNKQTKKPFTVSTLVRDMELEFNNKEYSTTVESAIFSGKNTKTKPVINIEFLGGQQKDVSFAHKIVTRVVENELPSGFMNGDWWTEYLATKGLKAEPLTEYQEWYKDELTSILVTKK
jgi:hypothetical protein